PPAPWTYFSENYPSNYPRGAYSFSLLLPIMAVCTTFDTAVTLLPEWGDRETALSIELSRVTASTEQKRGPKRFTILCLIFTAFLNVVGFTIFTPVLPFIVQRYLSNPDNLATVVGWLMASYAICQFIAAPGLGLLSDRFGRRPILLICLSGSVL